MATHGMTIAKASKDDFEKVYNLLSPMEELFNSKWCNEEGKSTQTSYRTLPICRFWINPLNW